MDYVHITGICPSVYEKLPVFLDKSHLEYYIAQLTAEINLIDFQLSVEHKYNDSFQYLFNWKDNESEEDHLSWKRKAFNALYRKVQQLEIMKATYKINYRDFSKEV